MPATPSVLVIDDDDDFRSVVCDELAHARYDVSEASGGREGVRRLEQTDVDVVLLDVQMPDLNGREGIPAGSLPRDPAAGGRRHRGTRSPGSAARAARRSPRGPAPIRRRPR